MKNNKPKNRGSVYVVVREMEGARTALLGAFLDLLEADHYCTVQAAEWFDKTKGAPASFNVVITTYYA